jgi:uncharacterized protein
LTKIILLSDTHGYLEEKAFKYIATCDEIWHAGDIGTIELADSLAALKPLKAVYGNIDGGVLRKQFKPEFRFMCEEVDVYMTHIGGYPGRYTPPVKQIIQTRPPQLFICGHSHILKIIYDKKNNLLHLNPGAAGSHGFHHVKTMLRFDINGKDIQNMEIIELGPRSELHPLS